MIYAICNSISLTGTLENICSTLSLLLSVLKIKTIGHRPRAHKPCGLHMHKLESAYHTDDSINPYLVPREKKIKLSLCNICSKSDPHGLDRIYTLGN